ncbi:hypothetical protein FVEN_g10884 [Fusarium venenatum]|uniref:Uncharacterized protein n=1 Tax=Fusarium venenatum TaxID=56646 RepID=A0A2L2TSG4_9HYPO|nr:uncharacterized protein FVRRES_00542 [Fusarium venenatum]KAG8351039.1 hypothetical protein FVEN_g10884 [Fusarium venenatum]KAH7006221.1 hypothetical protein EDB82DRAFT_534374 [Fusarium venenatum]CEI64030.1 unnamed protein product [Fusarium venenatum]
MSSSATTPEPNRLFALPSEILFQILKETTQKEQYWVNILTRRESPCGKKGRCNTLVYTKGASAQGPRSYPFYHECIFKRPVADGNIDIKDTVDKIWEQDLQANRLRNQINVYERSLDSDLVDNVRSLCLRIANEDIPFDELDLMCQRVPVLCKSLTAVLSTPDPIYGDPDEEQSPGEKQPFPSDDVVECQRLKHVMIRSSSWESRFDLTQWVFWDATNPFPRQMPISRNQMYFRMMIDERKIDDDITLLNQDWSLLTGLESLCFDLSTETWHRSLKKLRCLLLNMGKYLKLKTLVVFDFHKGTFEQPNMIALLMNCLQPGGELHLVLAIPTADLYR